MHVNHVSAFCDDSVIVILDATLNRLLTEFLISEQFEVTAVTGHRAATEAMETFCSELGLVSIFSVLLRLRKDNLSQILHLHCCGICRLSVIPELTA